MLSCDSVTCVKSNSGCPDVLGPTEVLLPVPDVAELMGQPVTKLFDLIGRGHLIAIRRDDVRQLPARFFNGLSESGEPTGSKIEVNKFVPGVILLLSDGGFSQEEIIRYLFTEDETLPGRPVDALHGHLAREVMRRAQAMAF